MQHNHPDGGDDGNARVETALPIAELRNTGNARRNDRPRAFRLRLHPAGDNSWPDSPAAPPAVSAPWQFHMLRAECDPDHQKRFWNAKLSLVLLHHHTQPLRNLGGKPIIVCRHACGDHCEAAEVAVPGSGTVELVYTPADGSPATAISLPAFTGPGAAAHHHVLLLPPPSSSSSSCFVLVVVLLRISKAMTAAAVVPAGVALAMGQTDASIEAFATTCFELAIARGLPLYLTTKDTILQV